MEKTFNIKVTMNKRWVPHFMSMLKYMEYLGKIGCSRRVALFADGDGDFNPKFETDISFTEVEPVSEHDGNVIYDAG